MFSNHEQYESITVLLERRVDTSTKKIVFVRDSNHEEHVTYSQLIKDAKKALVFITASGVQRGDELIMQIDDERTYLTIFLACILGNIIAVPLATGRQDEHFRKIKNVWDTMRNPFLIVQDRSLKHLDKYFKNSSEGDVGWWDSNDDRKILIPGVLDDTFKPVIAIDINADELAYLQFSSGSTGKPKGICISHSNVLHNTDGMLNSSGSSADETIVSWLPLTHDMGLIGSFLCGICGDLNTVIIPTSLFIKNPLIWMEKVNEHRGNISFSPNFGYKYFLRELETKERQLDWDLSCLRIIYNGAEQISYEIIDNFLNRLAEYSLSSNCMLTGYGLAEATLTVSIHQHGTPAITTSVNRDSLQVGSKVNFTSSEKDGITYVSCGQAIEHMQLRICNDNEELLSENLVGHIHINGPCITSGYYNRDNKSVFSKDGWLLTGDIGFVHNRNLYIVGREKEIIIINGVNFYPYDIEKVLEEEDAETFTLTKVAATSVTVNDTGDEKLVVFVQWRGKQESFEPIAEQVRSAILKNLGLVVFDVIAIKQMPKTTSGKLQRRKLAEEYITEHSAKTNNSINDTSRTPSKEQSFVNIILGEIRRLYGLTHINTKQSFIELGFDSLRSTELINAINANLNLRLSPTVVYEYSTIENLAKHLTNTVIKEEPTNGTSLQQEPIAIIGLSGKYPGGADSPEELWELLVNGTDTVSDIPEERWKHRVFFDEQHDVPGKTNTMSASLAHDIDKFDAEFFGISPREAESLDPQQRLLLEVSFNALQDAGYNLQELKTSSTGVFVGLSHSDYTQAHIHSGKPDSIDAYSLTGTINSTAAGRLSYFFNLSGPALIIDTACSSSLVAIHYAAQSLRSGDCEMAIAGGVNLILAPEPFISLTKIQALSPDGRCKTFDESANGYGRGEGCGMVVLKRLSQAQKDNDNIIGIIKSSAINQDGKSNGLTAPNGLAQKNLLQKAIQNSGLKASQISYVEAHGTGTPLGDPLEIQAMHALYGSKERELLTGSIKSNIGHLESAAGIAGLTKILLAFRHKTLPGNLHFNNPNPLIPWADMNIKVVNQTTPWEAQGKRFAAISSFGFSGTNAHLILEEPHISEAHKNHRETSVCTLSAHSIPALKQMATKLIGFITNCKSSVQDICYNINIRNNRLAYNWHAVINSKGKLLDSLLSLQNGEAEIVEIQDFNQPVAFQFTGQGAQYIGMGRELYDDFTVYREAIDKCCTIYDNYNDGLSLKSILFEENSNYNINHTQYAQPALFCTEYALTQLLDSYGIKPSIVAGHSLGEITAAVVAGIISLPDAIVLISERASLMQEQPEGGGMMSIIASEEDVLNIFSQNNIDLSIAGVNSKTQTVVSGLITEIEKLKQILDKKNIIGIPLTVSHAFHSALMKPAAKQFQEVTSRLQYAPPSIPVVSNITGKTYDKNDINGDYWPKHLLSAVKYGECLNTIQKAGYSIIIEVGPQPTLTNIGLQSMPDIAHWIPTLRKGMSATQHFLQSLAHIQEAGINVNWKKGEQNERNNYVDLPLYPFQKKRYWKPLSIGNYFQQATEPQKTTLPLYKYGYSKIDYPAVKKVNGDLIIVYNNEKVLANRIAKQYASKCTVYHIDSLPLQINNNAVVYYLADTSKNTNEYTDATSVLLLLQKLRASSVRKVIILTNNVHSSKDVNLNNSLLWGMVVTAKLELPALDISIIDTPVENIEKNFASIIDREDLPAQAIIADSEWLTPKMHSIDTKGTGKPFDNDDIYIVTGGLGSVGRQLIDWMIERGAKNIVILGRSIPNAEQHHEIDNWCKRDCNVQYIKADIGNRTILRKQLSMLNPSSIKGVFHSATIINDKLLPGFTKETFTSVFKGKVNGAWNLHELSKEWDLDHFVLFSSTVSVLGNAGQSNYAAANYYLNILAEYRNRNGLPAVSICWGPWQGSNLTKGLESTFEQFGVNLFDKHTAFGMLDNILSGELSGTIIAIDVNEDVIAKNCPAWIRPTVPDSWQTVSDDNTDIEEVIKVSFATEQDAIALLEKLSKEILKLNPEDNINIKRPYFEVGFDSLMLNTLKNKVYSQTGITIPIAQFFQYSNLYLLGQYIFETYSSATDSREEDIINLTPTNDIPDELVKEVEQLTDEDIAKLLDEYSL